MDKVCLIFELQLIYYHLSNGYNSSAFNIFAIVHVITLKFTTCEWSREESIGSLVVYLLIHPFTQTQELVHFISVSVGLYSVHFI